MHLIISAVRDGVKKAKKFQIAIVALTLRRKGDRTPFWIARGGENKFKEKLKRKKRGENGNKLNVLSSDRPMEKHPEKSLKEPVILRDCEKGGLKGGGDVEKSQQTQRKREATREKGSGN